MRLNAVFTGVLLASIPACARSQAKVAATPVSFQHADTAKLHRTLDSLAAAHHGIVGYTVRNIDTGELLSLRGDETFPTASLIKTAILVTAFDLAEKGPLDLDGPINVLKIDQVPGSGVLQFFHPGAQLSVLDAVKLMIILSDNTATNLVLDKVAPRQVWAKMESLGLPHTKVHSKVFARYTSVAMDSSIKYGLGVTTPNEMSQLFALLAQGKAVSPKADSAMLAILADNADGDGMERDIDGLVVPHKTGATDSVRTECALYRLQSRVAACVLTKDNTDTRWIVDNEPEQLLGKMGLAISTAWPRKPEPAAGTQ